MKLIPKQPPGRLTRKARDFEAEIVELRAQGYTLEAIRQALAAAGVHVSLSTVRRETHRQATRSAAAKARPPAVVRPTSGSADTALPAQPSGKELAEAFMRSQSTNPLIRAKEHP